MNEENLYTIKKGDTFWDLENEWDIPHGTLQELNADLDPRKLQIGQKVKIKMPTLVYLVAEKIPEPAFPTTNNIIKRNYLNRDEYECRIDNVYVHRQHVLKPMASTNPSVSKSYRKESAGSPIQSIHKGVSTAMGVLDLENIRRTKLLTSNELWHLQKNGVATHPWKTMRNGASHWKNNLVAGHRSTFQAAAKARAIAPAAMKYGGRFLFAADIGMSGEVKPSHVVNVILIGASSTGVGAIFAGIYFVADVGTGLVTGKSISDRLDAHVADEYGRLELYEGLY